VRLAMSACPWTIVKAISSAVKNPILDEIATKITPGAHAILLLDQAGWHTAPRRREAAPHRGSVQNLSHFQFG
jgi:hypothetical protein